MRNFFNVDEELLLIIQCVEALAGIYAEFDAWTQGESNLRIASLARRHVGLFGALRSRRTNPCLWEFIPKHHLLIHICEKATSNPKLSWNYGDESEIGCCACMARGCNQHALGTCLVERYVFTFSFEV